MKLKSTGYIFYFFSALMFVTLSDLLFPAVVFLAHASKAEITLSPTVSVPHAAIHDNQISGSGFKPGERILISYQDQVLRSTRCDEQGNFTTSISMPRTSVGVKTFEAKGLQSYITTSITLN